MPQRCKGKNNRSANNTRKAGSLHVDLKNDRVSLSMAGRVNTKWIGVAASSIACVISAKIAAL